MTIIDFINSTSGMITLLGGFAGTLEGASLIIALGVAKEEGKECAQ